MKLRGTRKERATLKKRKLLKRAGRSPITPKEREGGDSEKPFTKLISLLTPWILTVCFAIILNNLRAPRVRFYGQVIDPLSGPIAGASVPWKLEKYLWFDISGVAYTDGEGYFSINGRRLSGDILTIGPIDASGYQDSTPSDRRTFRYGWWRGTEEHDPLASGPVLFELRKNDSPTSP